MSELKNAVLANPQLATLLSIIVHREVREKVTKFADSKSKSPTASYDVRCCRNK